ncbi:malic acid transport protein [Echria macrotheca]|uniref:Malic acid transport protein n=1 Tax=Echria macrotheca TaxID=438768 RepID=A0AAJ0FAH3_9PEZI|nr:malic acid transport protein [Echria macrotheca]
MAADRRPRVAAAAPPGRRSIPGGPGHGHGPASVSAYSSTTTTTTAAGGYESPDENNNHMPPLHALPHSHPPRPKPVPWQPHGSASAPHLGRGPGRDPEFELEAAGGTGTGNSSPRSLDDVLQRSQKLKTGKTSIGDRIAEFRWTWFTMTMATGGIANVLHTLPYNPAWLNGIGLAFYFLNLCLFILNTVLISIRFRLRPGSFVNSFTDQMESLFISAFLVSIATILITTCQYGVSHTSGWPVEPMEAMFWIYLGLSVVVSAGLYLTLWSTQVFPIHTMTPVWVFPAYPLLLTAPFGANLISAASQSSRLDLLNTVAVAVASVTVQGTGFLISFMVCAAFLYRLMTQKLPRDAQRPGVFISIGPAGFTAAGLVQLGSLSDVIFPADLMGTEHARFILRLMAYMAGLWLWGLSIWFFLVSVGSLWKYLRPDHKGKMPFQMTWFSFVFPNTALVTATEALGSAFESPGLRIFGCVLAACIIVVWVFVFFYMLRCLWRREL